MIEDTRGVSITLNYVLTVAISTMLIVGLLVAGTTYVNGERERVVESELEVLGHHLAGDIATADRMVQVSDAPTDISVSSKVSETVAGSGYNVHVRAADGNVSLEFAAYSPDVTVTVPVANRTAVASTDVTDDELVIEYADEDGDGDRELVVKNA